MVTVGVLALQGAVREHEAVLAGLGCHTRRVRRTDDLDGLAGLVIPGGESTAIARLARGSGLLGAVRARIDAGMPALGTCAGLILLADEVADPAALAGLPTVGGLDVTVRRNAFGGQLASGEWDVDLTVSATTDGQLASGTGADPTDGRMRGVFIRAPRIERVGPGVEVLAVRDGEPVAVRQGPVVACTFHPELVPDATLHRLWLAGADLHDTPSNSAVEPS
ncbi:Pyridoxal 5'-phosphate synthase subunit PdxT [Tessaracoccus sp. O5.2]|uniref:pyridoxal 5'-phosphate synthase glutaminase subunit PdxT n=1 Tax=Tessaracoccus sp. O5.2 TaxID=3157622 RepID=UPI0035ED34AA